MKSKFCPKCGEENNPGSTKCICGLKLSRSGNSTFVCCHRSPSLNVCGLPATNILLLHKGGCERSYFCFNHYEEHRPDAWFDKKRKESGKVVKEKYNMGNNPTTEEWITVIKKQLGSSNNVQIREIISKCT